MIRGAHLRNERELRVWTDSEGRKSGDDYERLVLGGFTGVVAMWYHDPEKVLELGVDPRKCVVRLQDTVYKKWPSGEEYFPSWQDYARDTAETVARFYRCGFRTFVPDNEPNLTWPAHGLSVWAWQWFMSNAIFDPVEGLRVRLNRTGMRDAELVFPAMAHPDLYPDWLEVPRQVGLIDRFPRASAHCYWQRAEHMYWEQFGAGFKGVRALTGKRVLITECGNSSIQQPHPPPLDEIRARQAQDYPRYLEYVRGFSYVDGAYFFILGQVGWEGFDLTPNICRSIGQVQARRLIDRLRQAI